MLRVGGRTDIQRFGNFSDHKKLTKIEIWGHHGPDYQFGNWGKVFRSWFNPKLSLNPRELKNIRIFPSKIPQKLGMKQIVEKMKNVENLEIFGQILDLPEIGQFISSFTNLKTVRFLHPHSVPLQGKVFIYKSLGEGFIFGPAQSFNFKKSESCLFIDMN